LILREVLGFTAAETAEVLDTTVASVNSALQRARKAVEERTPERSQQATLRALGDERLRAIVERYSDAMRRADVDAVVAMLAEDAAWSMPPLSVWFRGLDGVRAFLAGGPLSGEWDWRHLPASANGQAAVAVYHRVGGSGAYLPFALDVMTLEGDRIRQITAFITRTTELDDFSRWPDAPLDERLSFEDFGLPAEVG
jgi:RNA polymerase sigma-70 factor, ECF subfamily